MTHQGWAAVILLSDSLWACTGMIQNRDFFFPFESMSAVSLGRGQSYSHFDRTCFPHEVAGSHMQALCCEYMLTSTTSNLSSLSSGLWHILHIHREKHHCPRFNKDQSQICDCFALPWEKHKTFHTTNTTCTYKCKSMSFFIHLHDKCNTTF